ncbi:MAG: MBL fold metallo-hydrolase [Candidatus Sericytochromatia bacterium]
MNIVHLRGGTYYIKLKYTNAGFYMYKKHCVLIDTGSTEEEGKEIFDYFVSKGITVDAIIITHAHADNLAGAHYIKNKSKCKLYSTKEEAVVIENPKKSNFSVIIPEVKEIEVTESQVGQENQNDKVIHFVPIKKKVIQNTVLKHEKCLVDGKIMPDSTWTMASSGHKFEIINLGGHTHGQIGVVTPSPDKVFFIGDSVYSAKELADNPIPYSSDISKTKKTLEYLLKSKYTMFVPTHGPHYDFSLTGDIYNNQRQIKMIEDSIIMHLSMPKTTDELVALVMSSFQIEENVPNFYALNSTISAYLEELKKAKKIKAILEKGKTRWFADL